MIDLAKTLRYLRPGEEWTLNGDSYDGLTWLSLTDKPTEKEINDGWPMAQQADADKAAADAAARAAAIAHAKSLGFTDEMIQVMYPALRPPA